MWTIIFFNFWCSCSWVIWAMISSEDLKCSKKGPLSHKMNQNLLSLPGDVCNSPLIPNWNCQWWWAIWNPPQLPKMQTANRVPNLKVIKKWNAIDSFGFMFNFWWSSLSNLSRQKLNKIPKKGPQVMDKNESAHFLIAWLTFWWSGWVIQATKVNLECKKLAPYSHQKIKYLVFADVPFNFWNWNWTEHECHSNKSHFQRCHQIGPLCHQKIPPPLFLDYLIQLPEHESG